MVACPAVVNRSPHPAVYRATVRSSLPRGLGESGMRIRKNAGAMAVPVLLIVAGRCRTGTAWNAG